MADLMLRVKERTVVGRQVKHIREQGWVPAVFYGPDVKVRYLQVRETDLERILRQGGISQLVTLSFDDGGRPLKALVREVQRHPTRRRILHADFYEVRLTEKLEVTVPLHPVGESPALKAGAILIHGLDSVEVECLPATIPANIPVDLSRLQEFDDVIYVRDLTPPEGVRILNKPDEVVLSLTVPRVLAAEEEAAEEAVFEVEEAPEVEVVAKGKAAKEGEGF